MEDKMIRYKRILKEFSRIFGFYPIPKRYIINLLMRGISEDEIFTIGTNAYSRNNDTVKNKYYYEFYGGR